MALELITGLRDSGHQVEVITSYWGNGDFRGRLTAKGFCLHIMRLGFISATLTFDALRMTAHQVCYWPSLALRYQRFLKKFEPAQVVHTNWHHLILLWLFLHPSRDIYWIHEVLPDKPQYRKVFGRLQRRLRCFVAVSNAVADSLLRLGIAPAKVQVIHNGTQDPSVGVFPAPGRGRPFRIGIVGQVGEWKGHNDMLEAFRVFQQNCAQSELHIIGRGEERYERSLRAQIDHLGIGKSVFWRGFLADRSEIYREMSVCVVPSRVEESFGMTAAEAGFFGIPVIATRRGGLPEIIEDGVTGFLVAPRNAGEIALRLEELYQNTHLRDTMGEQARARMLKKFGRDRLLDEFNSLLNNEREAIT